MESEEYSGTENIQDKLQEFLGRLPDNFTVLEEQIDVDIQMKYFNQAKSQNRDILSDEILRRKDELFADETDIKIKKEILILLAGIENPEAFRIIEEYKPISKGKEIYDWACIAYHESKMLLESTLLEQNQVFISTGMGGKGTDLRYFVVIIANNEKKFNNTQKKLINGEIEYSLSKKKSKIEEINFEGKYATLTCLIPLESTIKDIFQEAIDECNQYGNFINESFIVTNVKKLNSTEIDEFLLKAEKDDLEGEINIDLN
jgi:hypothetical protein